MTCQRSCKITGYDAISMQPNSGSQGEYAGLLDDPRLPQKPRRGASQRLPHPGLGARHQPGFGNHVRAEGFVVATDAKGNIDVDDFRAKAAANAENLAAAMITYPPPMACSRRRFAKSARSRTRMAARFTSTAPT